MSECTREFFLLNDQLLPVRLFDGRFKPPANYVYEVFRATRGVALFLEDHLGRFFRTADLSGMVIGISDSMLKSGIKKVIGNNGPDDGNLKISLYTDKDGQQLFIYYTPHFYPTSEEFRTGVNTGLLFAERNNPNAKVMDTRLREEADLMKKEQVVYEVLLVDHDGFITEGSRSNVFFIKDNSLITPPAGMVLEGITRKQIIQLAAENEIPLKEEKVHHQNLNNFDGLFISGTSRRVLPVRRVNELEFPVTDPLITKLQQLFEQKVNDYLQKS
ncbi:branched-chain amino acid aminotransferase [Lentimicrobium saccharophilum]|uniref:branched-chain-amino-acid transaminase n=1 Tax=Lentimicrobium saccharophilum TaxID=1678841 RepID=A0A0S7C0T9_9BACT|nr:aminotransferase class IV [Lentimicrobium saccharophilum]GAP44555.1 branched-chain amino acid aminotransferase [Lentimicrobium saccharophilum]